MKNKFRFRKNSIVSIIASLAILIIFNALFYNKMPAELPTHWNFQGEADDYSSKFHAMVVIQGFLVLMNAFLCFCLLYTSDAADDMQCVDLGGRRIIKK